MGSTQPDSPSTAAYTKKIEYTLDDNGNRSSVKVTPYGQSATTTSYTDNNLNQYTDVGGTTHSYDANGNLTDDGQYTYEYNFRNLLCRVKEGATVVASYQHDALGRRVKTIIGSACKRYIYSGAETIAVYDESNALLQEFVYGQVIDEVLMLEQADVLDADGDSNTTELARSFYHRNALGSIMAITEMDEDVAVSYRYDPYGAVTITRNGSTETTDPLGQMKMFLGRHYDDETSTYSHVHGSFSPKLGRIQSQGGFGIDRYIPGVTVWCWTEEEVYSRNHGTGRSMCSGGKRVPLAALYKLTRECCGDPYAPHTADCRVVDDAFLGTTAKYKLFTNFVDGGSGATDYGHVYSTLSTFETKKAGHQRGRRLPYVKFDDGSYDVSVGLHPDHLPLGGRSVPRMLAGAHIPGRVAMDDDRYDHRVVGYLQFDLTEDEFKAAEAKVLMDDHRRTIRFDLYSHNCADYAREVAAAAGRKVFDTSSKPESVRAENEHQANYVLGTRNNR